MFNWFVSTILIGPGELISEAEYEILKGLLRDSLLAKHPFDCEDCGNADVHRPLRSVFRKAFLRESGKRDLSRKLLLAFVKTVCSKVPFHGDKPGSEKHVDCVLGLMQSALEDVFAYGKDRLLHHELLLSLMGDIARVTANLQSSVISNQLSKAFNLWVHTNWSSLSSLCGAHFDVFYALTTPLYGQSLPAHRADVLESVSFDVYPHLRAVAIAHTVTALNEYTYAGVPVLPLWEALYTDALLDVETCKQLLVLLVEIQVLVPGFAVPAELLRAGVGYGRPDIVQLVVKVVKQHDPGTHGEPLSALLVLDASMQLLWRALKNAYMAGDRELALSVIGAQLVAVRRLRKLNHWPPSPDPSALSVLTTIGHTWCQASDSAALVLGLVAQLCIHESAVAQVGAVCLLLMKEHGSNSDVFAQGCTALSQLSYAHNGAAAVLLGEHGLISVILDGLRHHVTSAACVQTCAIAIEKHAAHWLANEKLRTTWQKRLLDMFADVEKFYHGRNKSVVNYVRSAIGRLTSGLH
eukprot:Colp12_sorted_trinity150504_noHs@16741